MDIEKELTTIKADIAKIKERNQYVEQNKKWETSNVRRVSIAILTYMVMVSFFVVTGASNPLINAIVPTIGFLISTISLGFIRQLWNNKRTEK